MERLIERCAGLDVHRDTVVTSARIPGPNGKRHQEVRTFGTTAAELLALRRQAQVRTDTQWQPLVTHGPRRGRRRREPRRTKDSALAARYRRVMRHRGHHKAVVAVAHAMLRAIYHLLAEGTSYRELGADYYDHRHQQRVSRRAIQLLERLGYQVTRNAAA